MSDFLTLFSSRSRDPFWALRPGKLLMAGAVFALTLSTILACIWPTGHPDDVPVRPLPESSTSSNVKSNSNNRFVCLSVYNTA